MFDYFENQAITDKWPERVACVKTIKTIFVAGKKIGKKVFPGERFTMKGLFYTSFKMAISVQIPMSKVIYFL